MTHQSIWTDILALRATRSDLVSTLQATPVTVDASGTIVRIGQLNVEIANMERLAGRNHTMITEIAMTVDSYKRCLESSQPTHRGWAAHHLSYLYRLQQLLPSGSGIDCGTKIDLDLSGGDKIVLAFSYHHMDQYGYYTLWTEHTAVVRPGFNGLNIRITGSDRDGIKEYLYQVYEQCLTDEVPALDRTIGPKSREYLEAYGTLDTDDGRACIRADAVLIEGSHQVTT
jgi:hypothetical protein